MFLNLLGALARKYLFKSAMTKRSKFINSINNQRYDRRKSLALVTKTAFNINSLTKYVINPKNKFLIST